MKKKKDDNENKNYKVPPIVIKQPIVPIIDRKPGIAAVSAAAPAFKDMEENPILTEAEQENLINGEKQDVAALADTEQKPRLMDSLITGEKAKNNLKILGTGKSIEGVPPVVDPKPKPESTGGNSVGNNFQKQKK